MNPYATTITMIAAVIGSIATGLLVRNFAQYLKNRNKPAHIVVKVESFSLHYPHEYYPRRGYITVTTQDGESYSSSRTSAYPGDIPYHTQTLGLISKYNRYSAREGFDMSTKCARLTYLPYQDNKLINLNFVPCTIKEK